MFPPGTAALRTWLSLQQKPSHLTGSYPSTTSSRKMWGPSCAPWGSRHLPTPDWPEDGHSPALCVAESSGPQQTTSRPEESVAQFIVFWLTFKLGVCLFARVHVFAGSLVGSAVRYLKWPNCSWWWSSFPWPVILSPRQRLGAEGMVNRLLALKWKRRKLLRFVPEVFFFFFLNKNRFIWAMALFLSNNLFSI